MSRSGFSLLAHSAHEIVFGLLDADRTEGALSTSSILLQYSP